MVSFLIEILLSIWSNSLCYPAVNLYAMSTRHNILLLQTTVQIYMHGQVHFGAQLHGNQELV